MNDQSSCCVQTDIHQAEAEVVRLMLKKKVKVGQVLPFQSKAIVQLSNRGTLVAAIARDYSYLISW